MPRLLNTIFAYFENLTQPFPDDVNDTPPPKALWPFFKYHIRGYEKILVLSVIFSIIYAMMEVSLFAFLGNLVDWLNTHDRATFLASEGWSLFGMGAMLLVAMPLVGTVGGLLQFQTSMSNFPMAARWRSHRYLLKQSMAFYQDDFAGRIATKVMQTALSVRETVMKAVEVFVYIGVSFLSMLMILLSIDFWLMLPMLIWALAYASVLRFYLPRLRAISQAQADARSLMTGRVVDAYSNIATVKLFAHTDREADYAKSAMSEFLDTSYAQMRWVNLLILSVEFCNYVLIFAVGAVGIALWMDSAVSAGSLAVAVAMALRLNGMAHWMMFEVSGLFEHIGTVTDGMNTLSKQQIVSDAADAPALQLTQGEIDFNNVSFSYTQKRKNAETDTEQTYVHVIKNLNLHIKSGERIGLVGRSGAGKSTLVNALLRFYDVQSGDICIDGQNIAGVQQDSLREHIAMVTQDTSLLHRSVRENILYGKPGASEAELQHAIEQAKVSEFIDNLTDPQGNTGLDAQVGERGVKLSGGQRQRIAIARVLLKNAPILILDEATSALDSEVEAAIQDSLTGLMDGKTVIAIAHRLSTIASLDRLIVLDEGRVVEQGSHQDLLQQDGIYAKLWAHQTGGFLGDMD